MVILEIFQSYSVVIFGEPKSRKCIVMKPNFVARVYGWAPHSRVGSLHAVS